MTSQKKHTVMAVVLMLGYVDLLTYFGGKSNVVCGSKLPLSLQCCMRYKGINNHCEIFKNANNLMYVDTVAGLQPASPLLSTISIRSPNESSYILKLQWKRGLN